MKKLFPFIVALGFLSPTLASAQQKPYVEVGFSAITIKDETNFLGDYNNGAIKLTVGSEITNWLAIEGTVGTGVGDDTNNVLGVPVTVKTKEFASLYLRPFVKINEQVELFGRLGYFSGKIQASALGQTVSETDSDFSYGVGVAFSLTNTSAIVLDYMQFYDKESVKITGFGIAYRQRF